MEITYKKRWKKISAISLALVIILNNGYYSFAANSNSPNDNQVVQGTSNQVISNPEHKMNFNPGMWDSNIPVCDREEGRVSQKFFIQNKDKSAIINTRYRFDAGDYYGPAEQHVTNLSGLSLTITREDTDVAFGGVGYYFEVLNGFTGHRDVTSPQFIQAEDVESKAGASNISANMAFEWPEYQYPQFIAALYVYPTGIDNASFGVFPAENSWELDFTIDGWPQATYPSHEKMEREGVAIVSAEYFYDLNNEEVSDYLSHSVEYILFGADATADFHFTDNVAHENQINAELNIYNTGHNTLESPVVILILEPGLKLQEQGEWKAVSSHNQELTFTLEEHTMDDSRHYYKFISENGQLKSSEILSGYKMPLLLEIADNTSATMALRATSFVSGHSADHPYIQERTYTPDVAIESIAKKMQIDEQQELSTALSYQGQWTTLKEEYIIIYFNIDNDSSLNFSQKVRTHSLLPEPTAPIKEGYQFLGWYYGDKKWDFKHDLVEKDMRDLTLYAHWELIDTNNGNDVEPEIKPSLPSEKAPSYHQKDNDGGSNIADRSTVSFNSTEQISNITSVNPPEQQTEIKENPSTGGKMEIRSYFIKKEEPIKKKSKIMLSVIFGCIGSTAVYLSYYYINKHYKL